MKKMQGVGLQHLSKMSKRLNLSAEAGDFGVNTDQLVHALAAVNDDQMPHNRCTKTNSPMRGLE
jgi:hypothetical protein